MKRFCINIGQEREIKIPITIERFNDCCIEDIEILPILIGANPMAITFELGYFDENNLYQRISPIDATFSSRVKIFDLIVKYPGVSLEETGHKTFDFNYLERCEEDFYTHSEKIELRFESDCATSNNKKPEITSVIKEDGGETGDIYNLYIKDVPNAESYTIKYCKDDTAIAGEDFNDCSFIEDIPAGGNLKLPIPSGELDNNELYEITIFATGTDGGMIGESDTFTIRTDVLSCNGETILDLSAETNPLSLEESDWNGNEFQIAVYLVNQNSDVKEYRLNYRLKGETTWSVTDSVEDLFTDEIELLLTETNSVYEVRVVAECEEEICAKSIAGNIFEIETPFVEGVGDDDDDQNDEPDFSDDVLCCDVDKDSIVFENITTTSMRVLWDAVDNVDTYLVRWKANFEPESEFQLEVVPGDRNYLELEGLFSDTLYDLQIKVRCKIEH